MNRPSRSKDPNKLAEVEWLATVSSKAEQREREKILLSKSTRAYSNLDNRQQNDY